MRSIVLPILFGVAASTSASANSVNVSAQLDNTMYFESGQKSNGAGTYFFSGMTGQGDARRGLIKFDVAAVIPAGSTINSVDLVLFMSKSNAGPHDIGLHPALASWGEGTSNAGSGEGDGTGATTNDATWTHRFYPTVTWASVGGDFAAAPSATLSVFGVGSYTWVSTPALVADVQAWITNPSTNYGWLLLNTNEMDAPTAKRFNSRTSGDVSQRPRLVVDFTPPVPPQGFCFGDGSGTACPCANAGAAGNGCASSINANGANLAASGMASLVADTLVLQGSGMPDSTVLYCQGTTQAGAGLGATFGDGLRCAGGSIVRLGKATNAGGASQYPSGPDLPVSIRGAIPAAGTVRHYQGWYRNAASYCTVDTFNLTNGLTVTWGP